MTRLIYWIRKSFYKNRDCRKCCLNCKYFEICRRDY